MFTIIICIVTCIISFVGFSNADVFQHFAFNSRIAQEGKQPYRYLTHGFLHADFFHLLWNMIALYSFGSYVESYFEAYIPFGAWVYVGFYLSAIIIAEFIGNKFKDHSIETWGIGASGGVSALILAGVLLDPLGMITFYFIPMPSWVFSIVYLVFSYFMAKRAADNVDHLVHLVGAVYGIIFMLILNPSLFLHFINEVTSSLGINLTT